MYCNINEMAMGDQVGGGCWVGETHEADTIVSRIWNGR